MKKKEIFKIIIIPIIIGLSSIGIGAIFNDWLIGGCSLALAFIGAYFMILGKWYGYIFEIVYAILYTYIKFINGLYAPVFFSLCVFIPFEIYGIIGWKKKEKNKTVITRSLSIKNFIILTVSVIAGSFLVGYLLSLIPYQNLSYLDSASQIANSAAILLCAMRYREAWFLWLCFNCLDLAIWSMNINNSANAIMMLIITMMYFISNIFGLMNWIKLENKNKGIP